MLDTIDDTWRRRSARTTTRRRTTTTIMSLSMLIVVMAAATMGSAVHAFTTPLAPRRTPAAVARRAAAPDDPPPATTDALFPVDDDDLDDIDYNFVEIVDDDDDEGLTAAAGGLYEIDYEDDALFSAADDVVTATTTDDDGPADTVDRLEEREDRLYVDEFGIRRKVERCILVGVENLSQRRKEVRRHPEVTDGLADATAADSISSIISSNSLSPPSPPPLHDTDVYFTLEESMAEMRELVKTAGMEIVGTITQRMNQVNPKTYVGSGKVIEALELLTERDACTVVFDAELSPGQQKSLENAFNKKLLQNDFLVSEGEIKVLDRTALILDIFAQHAKTREGKLQVDLALHEFRKPRLTKMWTHLERQSGAGGVGLRGPGESQLEIDKRLLRDRIITLKQKIDDVQKHRTMHRRGRERLGLPILSLVGYTNAGKSSLLNYLTKAGVMADSMLFATLDPTTRKVKLPGYRTHPEVLLTDTVGFIQKLPTHLVAAFRATLEEVKEADVLIHVIDVSNPTWEKQERAVISVLTDMGAADKPIVRVLNKIDLLDPLVAERLKVETSTMAALTVAVSALNGDGLMDFVAVVEEALVDLLVPIEVEIPYSKGDELNAVHEQGNVEVVDYRAEGTYVQALVPTAVAERLSKYSVNPEPSTAQGRSGIDDGIDWVSIGRGRHKTPKE